MAEDFRQFRDSVRKIAETEELKDKVDKALESIDPLTKDAINSARSYGYQEGSGTIKDGFGAAPTGPDGTQDVVTSAGDSATVAVNSPNSPVNPFIPASSISGGSTDAATGYYNKKGTISEDESIFQNNGSGSVSPSTGPGGGGGAGTVAQSAGGSTANTQAQTVSNPDYTNTEQTDRDDARTDVGASAEEAAAERIYDQQQQNGVPGTVTADGLASGTQSPSVYYPGQGRYDRIEGILGIDPDDINLTIVANLFPKSYIPSLEDSTAAGHDVWTDPSLPPVKKGWELGIRYTAAGSYLSGGTAEDSSPYGFINMAVGYYSVSFGYTVTDVRSPSYSFDVNGRVSFVDFEAYVDWTDTAHPENTGWAAANISITAVVCTPGSSDECPITPPRETSYPTTGTGILQWLGDKWGYSIYNSEIPEKYKNLTTSVDFKLRDGTTWALDPTFQGGWLFMDKAGASDGLYFDYRGRLRDIVKPENKIYYTST